MKHIPTPRVTLWVPVLIAAALSGLFLVLV
jgi:hypothetical protein